MSCATFLPGGTKYGCISQLNEAVAMFIMTDDVSFASQSAVDNLENIRVLIQEGNGKQSSMYVLPLQGLDPTMPEVVTETTGYGDTIPTGEIAGMLVGYAKINPCDFKEILSSLKNTSARVGAFLKDGSVMLQDKGAGLKGFKSILHAVPFGIPGRENKAQQFKINVYFQAADEMNNYVVIPVNYDIADVEELSPVGLTVIEDALSGATQNLDIKLRCTDIAFTDVVTAEIIRHNVTSPTVTITTGVATVKKESTPVNLVAGDYIEYRVVKKTGDVYDYISNVVKATV